MATFNLTAAFDKPSYDVGETMTLTVSGTVVAGDQPPVAATITVQAQDGSITTLTAGATVNGGGEETWVISKASDTSGRVWTIAGDGHSVTAVA